VQPLGNITAYDPNDFRWRDRFVQFTNHAKLHLEEFGLDVHEIIDMLHDPVDCPKKRKFHRTDIEICSRKNRRIFRIILSKDDCYNVGECCWVVRNVKPA